MQNFNSLPFPSWAVGGEGRFGGGASFSKLGTSVINILYSWNDFLTIDYTEENTLVSYRTLLLLLESYIFY